MQSLILGNLGLALKGPWDSQTAYSRNDIVSYMDVVWGAMEDIDPGQTPGSSPLWAYMIQGGVAASGSDIDFMLQADYDQLSQPDQLNGTVFCRPSRGGVD